MHAQELVQLAAYVAIHGSRIVQSRASIPEPALQLYWTASKCRLDRWFRELKSLASIPFGVTESWTGSSERVDSGVLDEILISDVLSRTWTAICRASDGIRGVEESGPIAASVLAGQSEARQRVLNLMVYGQGIGVENAVNLNRRRLKHEHRNDWLLSFLARLCDISDLAFDSHRVARLASAQRHDYQAFGAEVTASLSLAAMTMASLKSATYSTGNEDMNRKIACGILGSFPASIFDTTGCVGSARYLTLWGATPDMQGQVNIESLPNEFSRHRPNRLDRYDRNDQ